MKTVVVDGSAALGFLLPDEQGTLALNVMAYLEKGGGALVPRHWWLS